jgi:hypothetical protein
MQVDYPDRAQLMAHEVGWWHLHPGYFSSLSVGDVEECRKQLGSKDDRVLQLLMYGDGRGYQLSAYAIGLEDVVRFPVRISEPVEGK